MTVHTSQAEPKGDSKGNLVLRVTPGPPKLGLEMELWTWEAGMLRVWCERRKAMDRDGGGEKLGGRGKDNLFVSEGASK